MWMEYVHAYGVKLSELQWDNYNLYIFSVAYYTIFQFPLFFNMRVMKLKVKGKIGTEN